MKRVIDNQVGINETERMENKTIEVTVYDANPSQSGPSAWPETYTAKIVDGRISAGCRARIARDARKCGGEYNKGDRLWLIARDANGINVAEDTIRL